MALSTTNDRDGIVADNRHVPGTELLYDLAQGNDADGNLVHSLQHVRKGDSHILLVPQPSLTDPNDPLRWSRIKKSSAFANGLAFSFLGAVTGPIMAAGMVQLSEVFNTSFQRLTYANGATLICQGVANIFWMPFAIKFGRRPVYLLSTLLMGVACVWLGVCSDKTYTPFLIGRAFLGIFEAPIESIVPSTVTDIYFLHDRGAKVALYGLSVLGGNELGPLLSAFIIQNLGMGWAFYIVAAFIGLNLITMIFFMPETKFTGERISTLEASTRMRTKEGSPSVTEIPVVQQRRTYLQEILSFGKPDPNVSLLKSFLRPFVLLAYPTVLWSCLIYGMALSWNVILGATIAQIFAPPPYLFNSSAQGLVFASPLVGSLIGTYLCGPLADRVANHYTKKNRGIREPEMRLPTCIVAAVLTFLGALVYGLCLVHQTHWMGPIVGIGILSTGAQMGATLAMSYSIDCHQDLSVELMVTVATLKSCIAWIWTWIINDWLARDGPLLVFLVIAAVNVAVYLTTVVLYLKGRSIRLWLHRTDIFGKLGL